MLDNFKKYKYQLNGIKTDLQESDLTSLEIDYALAIVDTILKNVKVNDRTGTGVLYGGSKSFTYNYRTDISVIPKLFGKSVSPHIAYKEMLWFMMGKTDKESLNRLGVKYWNEFFKEDGTIGKAYGYQFRNFNGIDQLSVLCENLKNNPYSRRNMINLWNVSDLEEMALPPCFYKYNFTCFDDEEFSFYSHEGDVYKGYLVDLTVGSRSADAFLGVPYNFLSSYFLAQCILGYVNEAYKRLYTLNSITWNCDNFHVYQNHIQQCEEYVKSVIEYYYTQKEYTQNVRSMYGRTFDELINVCIMAKKKIKERGEGLDLDKYLKEFEEWFYNKCYNTDIHYKSSFLPVLENGDTPPKIEAPLSV